MILVITFRMIIACIYYHPILDDSCHHFSDDYCVSTRVSPGCCCHPLSAPAIPGCCCQPLSVQANYCNIIAMHTHSAAAAAACQPLSVQAAAVTPYQHL